MFATNNNRVLFTGNLTAEPELNYPPKGTAVVNLANNEFYTFEGGERQQITKVLHAGPRASRRRNASTQPQKFRLARVVT